MGASEYEPTILVGARGFNIYLTMRPAVTREQRQALAEGKCPIFTAQRTDVEEPLTVVGSFTSSANKPKRSPVDTGWLCADVVSFDKYGDATTFAFSNGYFAINWNKSLLESKRIQLLTKYIGGITGHSNVVEIPSEQYPAPDVAGIDERYRRFNVREFETHGGDEYPDFKESEIEVLGPREQGDAFAI